jgi:hypothetical protein
MLWQGSNVKEHPAMSKAKTVALSQFWSHQQRFFNYLFTAQKTLSLIQAIERDLQAGHACVVQLISTNEAMLERKLSQIPTDQWDDLQIDISPKEYVMEYLLHSFPTQLHEKYEDEEGQTRSRPVIDAQGNPVHCQQALAIKQGIIEDLALLPPVPTALDAILWHFGTDNVAECTGRTQRIVKEGERLKLEKRSSKANIAETQAFMNDQKRILVFSTAGGTGRSYHSDANCANQRLRRHYLLEAGWQASVATQGLGRTNRSNQVQPPVFIPVTTNVKGEKRFISAIARRLDSLGALTKGSRKTGSQNLWRETDNLENVYARAALRDLYQQLYRNQIEGLSLDQFEAKTGLKLTTTQGALREELPPIKQFLNRLLALEIEQQNLLFGRFEQLLEARVQEALDNGSYETGVESLQADGFRIIEERELFTHLTGGKTLAIKIERRDKINKISLDEALCWSDTKFFWNARSNNVALGQRTFSGWNIDGSMSFRMRLYSPDREYQVKTDDELAKSHWEEIPVEQWSFYWEQSLCELPAYSYRTFYLIVGLLLPIYSKLPKDNPRIYRLQADDGRILLGRYVSESNINGVYRHFGLLGTNSLLPQELWEACYHRHEVHSIGSGDWKLRAARVAGQFRLEITGVHQREQVQALTHLGCFSEIIQHQLRVFVPTVKEEAIAILESLSSTDN